MNKKRKIVLITGIILIILVSVFTVRYISNSKIAREIPVVSENSLLSVPVKNQINQALTNAKRKPNASNLGTLGMVYHSSANYKEAAKCYQLAINQEKNEWIWNYYHGYLNMELGNSDAVIENFNQVLSINPDVYLAKYYLGEEYRNLREYELAENSFNDLSEVQNREKTSNDKIRKDHFPLSTYASFQLGRIYFDQGENELARTTLHNLIQKNKLFGPAYKLLGTIYTMEGDTELGNKYTIRANDFINFSPPVDTLMDKIALMSRSELYLLKKIDEAEDSFHSDWALQLVNQGLKYIPENSYFVSKAIKIYLWKNQNEKAIALIDKHLELVKGDYSEIKNTGLFFHRKGLCTEAIKYWTKALEIKSDEISVIENHARCLWATGRKKEVIDFLNEILKNNPNDNEMLASITDQLFQYRETELANINLQKLKKADPKNPVAKRLSADIAMKNKDLKRAISLYESAFEGNPKDAKTIQKLGEIYKYQQLWRNYIRLYSNALDNNQNNPDYLATLGEVYISCPDTTLTDFEKGKEYSERAFTHYNCPPKTLIVAGTHLAYAYARLGDMKLANVTISQTVNIGRKQNIPEEEQKRLEVLHKAFQNLSN